MKQNGNSERYKHGGRNTKEYLDYHNWVNSQPSLDKTDPDPVDSKRTDQSSVKDRLEKPSRKVTKKSTWLTVKDFANSNVGAGILVTVFTLLVGGAGAFIFSMNREQGVIEEKVRGLEDKTEILRVSSNEDSRAVNDLKNDLAIFKTFVGKDIEYLKATLNFHK